VKGYLCVASCRQWDGHGLLLRQGKGPSAPSERVQPIDGVVVAVSRQGAEIERKKLAVWAVKR